ncbi:MAG: HmuY family protein [Cyclobacteriaceae bacterium]|nr:HmuY family protein [Cyclobacteriaceae bacterium]
MYIFKKSFHVLTIVVILMTACSDGENLQLPDNLVNFVSEQLSFQEDEASLSISLSLSRPVETEAGIQLEIESANLVYGEHFTTTPAAINNVISLSAEVGSRNIEFILNRVAGALFEGDEQLTIRISAVPEPLVKGASSELLVAFDEVVSASGSMQINGGGSEFPNVVFIHLAGNRQTAINRSNWDLEFYNGDDAFVVKLNGTIPMMARALDKTDFAEVIPADTTGFAASMIVGPNSSTAAAQWIDNPSGDLEKTAIASISADATQNKIHIINLSNANPPSNPADEFIFRGWKMVKIDRDGGAYKIQFANLDGSDKKEARIEKSARHRFSYFSFDNGMVNVAPQDARWDIAWSAYSNLIPFQGGFLPYFFQDIVIHNLTGTRTAEVMVTDISYQNFASENLQGLTFSDQNQLAIGSRWRAGGGPGQGPSIRNDRYYIIHTSGDRYYKLRFTSLTTSGERGRPQFEYALIP